MVNIASPPFSSPDENGFAHGTADPFSRSGLDPVFSNTSQLLDNASLPLTVTASYKSSIVIDPTPMPTSRNNSGAPIDIPLGSLLLLNTAIPTPSSARRARSGSLFSTNSIWNDDSLLLNSPSRTLINSGMLDLFPEMSSATSGAPGAGTSSASSFISPVLSAQPSTLAMANPTRNRSHTTSNHSFTFGVKPPTEASRLSMSPFFLALPEPSLLDNMVINMGDNPAVQTSRNRSQTYSGVTSKLSELTLAMNPFPRRWQPLQMPLLGQLLFADAANQSFEYPLAFASEEFLQDDFDFFDLSISTSFDNPNLGPTSTLLLDNLPQIIDAAGLLKLLSNPINGLTSYHNPGISCVRVCQRSNSKLALVSFISIEAAMHVKASFNHLELVPGVILYVAFAKVGDRLVRMSRDGPSLLAPNARPHNSQPPDSVQIDSKKNRGSLESSSSANTVESLMDTVCRLSASQPIDLMKVVSTIKRATAFPKDRYEQSFGSLPEPMLSRLLDAPKLREMRKALENCEKAAMGQTPSDSETNEKDVMAQLELEALCLSILDELPEICYDHIGNTVVQKLFAVVASPEIKLIMVKELAPYFAQLGIHKNGTWAIQKLINNSVDFCLPKVTIADSLKPYAVKLFNDQFGNYVLQCCLKFGSPYNDFIFEAVYGNFLEISCGRFGARCLRAILETASDTITAAGSPNGTSSGSLSNEQLFLVSSLIVENAPDLVVNNNGSLLVTWFLDTFSGCKNAEYDFRYSLLCDKLMSSFDQLCSHKLGSLTIYKLLSNRIDPGVKTKIMTALFGKYNEQDPESTVLPKLLESILQDSAENNSGPLFVYKILTNPSSFCISSDSVNQKYHQFVLSQVKRVLMEINIVNQQPYKKLMDEVGLLPSKINKALSGRKLTRGNSHFNGTQANTNHTNGTHRNGNHMNRLGNMQQGMGHPGMAMSYSHPSQIGTPYAYNNYQNGNGVMYPPSMQFGTVFTSSGYNYNANAVRQAQREQDFSVMDELEQLSLSSAAMGYGSNPQTPLSNMGIGRELFF